MRDSQDELERELNAWAERLKPLAKPRTNGNLKRPRGPRLSAEPLEKHIQKEILKLFNLTPGIIAFEFYNSGKFSTKLNRYITGDRTYRPKGTPDICGSFYGRAFWIEVKRPGQKLDHEQVKMRDVLMAKDCAVGLCRSVDDAKAFILYLQSEIGSKR